MADETRYVPARHTLLDARSGLVSRPWLAFFQRLAGAAVDLTVTVGSLALSALPPQAASTLLGRRSTSSGTPEVITLGTGLVMTGTVLSVVAGEEEQQVLGRWEVLTNGIVDLPEDIYALGDCIMVWVKD